MLLCAGILGRYYTDQHNVDEDIDTIPSQGGSWVWNTGAGAYLRQPDNPLNNTVDTVAFNQKIYTTNSIIVYILRRLLSNSIIMRRHF